MDALQLVELARRRLVDLSVSENFIRDPKVADAAAKIWSGDGKGGGLVSDLWVQGAFPSKQSSDSLGSFAQEGLFPADLCRYLDGRDGDSRFPKDRKLFTHQAKLFHPDPVPVKGDSPSFVIKAGTGAGKTEAFLLPILADLWKHARKPGESGMRCLILYPMNALVTDQVTRLYGSSRIRNGSDCSISPARHRKPTRRPRNQSAGRSAARGAAYRQGRTFPIS